MKVISHWRTRTRRLLRVRWLRHGAGKTALARSAYCRRSRCACRCAKPSTTCHATHPVLLAVDKKPLLFRTGRHSGLHARHAQVDAVGFGSRDDHAALQWPVECNDVPLLLSNPGAPALRRPAADIGQDRLVDLLMRIHTMLRLTFTGYICWMLAIGTVAMGLPGCSTSANASHADLASIGVIEGAMYWEAEQKLASGGYRCFVTGAKRENFDCTKTVGFFPTCLLRVTFVGDDKNLVAHLRVAQPACMGTP
jgi:hypothetical protein